MISRAGLRDQVFTATPAALRVPAYRVIDRLDGTSAAAHLMGTAVALVAMAEATGMDPHELVQTAHNAMRDVEGPFTAHVQAIRDYAKNELKEVF